MAPLPVTFRDLEDQFCCLFSHASEIQRVLSLNMSRKAHVACNFNYLFKNELLKVTASHVPCECGNISETAQI